MKRTMDHLPVRKQVELNQAVNHLVEGLRDTLAGRQATALELGRVLKVVLYGSHASGQGVFAATGRFISDIDLFVMVNSEALLAPEFWQESEARILADPHIRTPIAFVVQTLDEVNAELAKGSLFFAEMHREGVMLYDFPSAPLIEPAELPARAALAATEAHVKQGSAEVEEYLAGAAFYRGRENNRLAAFNLHQAAERLYRLTLQALTLYAPRSHNLAYLRPRAEALAPELAEVWPRDARADQRAYELLRAAYEKARYDDAFRVSDEALAIMTDRVGQLKALVAQLCRRRLAVMTDRAA